MKITDRLRSRRFWVFARKLTPEITSLQSLMERGWTASITVVGGTPVLTIELPNSADHFPLPGEDPSTVAAFASEWNRRVKDLHEEGSR